MTDNSVTNYSFFSSIGLGAWRVASDAMDVMQVFLVSVILYVA